jgi:hypothetical protein
MPVGLDDAEILNNQVLNALTTMSHLHSEIQAWIRVLREAQTIRPRPFSMRDPRWYAARLGTSNQTIGLAGCLITSIASMLCDIGYETTPAAFNDWLVANGGYASGNEFVWASIEKLGAKVVNDIEYSVGHPTDEEIAFLRSFMRNGYHIIVKVDIDLATRKVDQHYVRLLAIDENNANADIMDPWPRPDEGNLIRLCPRYGKTLKYALWRAVIYSAAGA